MTEMEERLAKRLFAMEVRQEMNWADAPDYLRQSCLFRAKAVLDELTRPTEDMIEAGCSVDRHLAPGPMTISIYTAMVRNAAGN